jgi:N6-adenosine-specific RNA methylase IME4
VKRPDPVVFRMDLQQYLSANKKTFDVILADPPWLYGDSITPKNRRPEMHYNTMSVEDICNLPVSQITNKTAILFLWCPSPKLTDAMKVIEAWGFQYSTKMAWLKTSQNGQIRIGLGNNVRNTSEELLIAKKGPYPMPKMAFPSTIYALQTDHSRKPARSYEIIENMYPEATRIELFARYVYPGWVGVGNEAEPKPKNVYIPKEKTYTNSKSECIQIQNQDQEA